MDENNGSNKDLAGIILLCFSVFMLLLVVFTKKQFDVALIIIGGYAIYDIRKAANKAFNIISILVCIVAIFLGFYF